MPGVVYLLERVGIAYFAHLSHGIMFVFGRPWNLAIRCAAGTRSHDNVLPIVCLNTFILLVSGRYSEFHGGPSQLIRSRGHRLAPNPPPPSFPGLRAAKQWRAPSGGSGRPTVHSPDRAANNLKKALPWDRSVSSALLTSGRCSKFRDSLTRLVLSHVLCLTLPLPPLVHRASSVWPRGAPIYIAALCRRSVTFVRGAGPRSRPREVLSAGTGGAH
ncbi:hypothetical protein NDU88_002081 [Pleurodeles waltl]|uniref:Uncharacterized protein n=1 Tax=Pleurodeles waltl TaxID=8319 RepID=A0AAV7UUJ1_PLEWA|nr:hypothetical protein NDU88_002081 [Pleurodeles waltl]